MYYPKNKIETNLYSNGELAIESTLQPYFGFYFKTVNGDYFTGKEPNDGDNTRLILTKRNPTEDVLNSPPDLRYTSKNITYTVLTSQNEPPITPTPFFPQLSEGDYQTGEFTRYFAKKRNENIYYEIANLNVSTNPIYLTFSLQWVISGKEGLVSTINKNTVDLYMRNLPIPAFNKFLKDDYLKFWKPS